MSVPFEVEAQLNYPPYGGGDKVDRSMEVNHRPASYRGFNLKVPVREPVVARAELASFLREEIIPRLALAHRDHGTRPEDIQIFCDTCKVQSGDVLEFTTILSSQTFAEAVAFVEGLRSQGNSLATIFLHLFAPTARRLGEFWEEDRLDFFDVTIGLSRLQQLLRTLAPFLGEGPKAMQVDGPKALLGPAAGEQHTFGVFMVGEFFRRAGWGVTDCCVNSVAELTEAVADEWFDVAGFSLSAEIRLGQLAEQIRAARAASLNQGIRIMVGGRVFTDNPHLISAVDADGTANDGEQAVEQADLLIGRKKNAMI